MQPTAMPLHRGTHILHVDVLKRDIGDGTAAMRMIDPHPGGAIIHHPIPKRDIALIPEEAGADFHAVEARPAEDVVEDDVFDRLGGGFHVAEDVARGAGVDTRDAGVVGFGGEAVVPDGGEGAGDAHGLGLGDVDAVVLAHVESAQDFRVVDGDVFRSHDVEMPETALLQDRAVEGEVRCYHGFEKSCEAVVFVGGEGFFPVAPDGAAAGEGCIDGVRDGGQPEGHAAAVFHAPLMVGFGVACVLEDGAAGEVEVDVGGDDDVAGFVDAWGDVDSAATLFGGGVDGILDRGGGVGGAGLVGGVGGVGDVVDGFVVGAGGVDFGGVGKDDEGFLGVDLDD